MNKTMFLGLVLLVVAGPLVAQERHQHAPAAVKKSFQRDYPDARDPQWTSANGRWHANFTDHRRFDRGEMVANYDRTGHHVDSRIPYDRNDVPSTVINRTEGNYPGGKNYSYTRIERTGGQPLFQVDLYLKNRNKTVYVDENGHEQAYHARH